MLGSLPPCLGSYHITSVLIYIYGKTISWLFLIFDRGKSVIYYFKDTFYFHKLNPHYRPLPTAVEIVEKLAGFEADGCFESV